MDDKERLETVAAAFDQLPLLITITQGADQRLVAMSASARATIGAECLDEPFTSWLPDLFGAGLTDEYEQTSRTGVPFLGRERRLQVADPAGWPREGWFDVLIAPVPGPDGRTHGVVCVGQEVSEQVRARQRAREVSADLERRYHAAEEVVTQLQDAVLPKGLPVLPEVDLAAGYLLAEDRDLAGGDWFDAVPLDDGRIVTAVGDVVGHGVEAAVVAGELKALFEEAVHARGDVAAAVRALDVRARRDPASRTATIGACLLDPATGDLDYVTAGHPPPLVVSGGETSYLPPSGAGPLGANDEVACARHQVRGGDLLVLYSDGLVERPGRSHAQNVLDLSGVVTAAVSGAASPPWPSEQVVERVCRQALELLPASTGYRDDITLLALQSVPRTGPLALHLPAIPDAVRTVRIDVDDWLSELAVGDVDRVAVQHAVGELVTNSVEHAYDTVAVGNTVRVELELSDQGMLTLAVEDDGTWRDAGDGAGRGLGLVGSFLDELHVERGPGGTRAVGRHRLSRPASLLTGSSVPGVPAAPTTDGQVQQEGDVLRVSGDVDREGAARLARALEHAARAGTQEVLVDLTGVTLLASAGVHVLVEAREGGPVRLRAPMGSPAQHVLDLVRLPYES